MIEWIFEQSALPNLHPAIVHFPIALFSLALAMDIAAFVLKKYGWLEKAALLLYGTALLGAGAAYLAGRSAADAVGLLSPPAQKAVALHADWGLYTLLAFAVVVLVRGFVFWKWSRPDAAGGFSPGRWALLLLAGAAMLVLVRTAELGGALVYRHAVAVTAPENAPSSGVPPAAAEAESGPRSSVPQRGLRNPVVEIASPGSGWRWEPAAGGGALLPALDAEAGALTLSLDGEWYLLAANTLADLQMEAVLDVSQFRGACGLAFRRHGDSGLLFFLDPLRKVQLVQVSGSRLKTLDRDEFDPPQGRLRIAVSAAGRHLKGYVGSKQVVHGHVHEAESGRTGFWFQGQGRIRILSLKVTRL